MPEAPSGRALKYAVKISPEQVGVVEALGGRSQQDSSQAYAHRKGVCGEVRLHWVPFNYHMQAPSHL